MNRAVPQRSILFIMLAALLSFFSPVPGMTEDRAPGGPTTAGLLPDPSAIALTEIAPRAVEVSSFLRTLDTTFASSPDVQTIDESLREISRRIDSDLAGIVEPGKSAQRISTLQAQEQRWQRRQKRLSGWLEVLTKHASHLQDTIDRLTNLQKTWSMTAAAAKDSQAPPQILAQIEETLTAISAAQASLEPQRTALLDLQLGVARDESRCGGVLALMANAEHSAMGGVLARENPPVWNSDLWAQTRTAIPAHVRRIVSAFRDDIHDYLHDPTAGMPGHVILFAVLTVLFVAARHRVRQWTAMGIEVPARTKVFDRPYAAALAGAMLVATSPASTIPSELKGLFAIVAVVAMIRVSLPLIPPSLGRALYGLGVLFAVDAARQSFIGTPLADQVCLIFESLGGIILVAWSRAFGDLHRITWGHRNLAQLPILRFVVGLVLALLAIAALASALGYLPLARLLTPGLLAVSTLALGLYATFQVASGVVDYVLRVRPMTFLRMVQNHRDLLERRVCRLLAWVAVIVWLGRSLEYLGFLKPVLSSGQAILTARLERGSISISLEEVLAFLLAIWAAYLLSKFTRFALEEDVHPRTHTSPGLSYAVSTLLHYVLLALGFIVGLGFLGVDLTKVTVLLSAFGVGIGFGLQSVVNNFASGLILLIERPVNSGDTVEIGGLSGKVRHIGIRATIVRTSDGADTIVPNSQLVSEKVVNWTLSDRLRRIRLPVGVNYGAPPDEVIQLLVSVASAHPGVLQNPEPGAVLISYGDSAINYELRVWTDRFEESTQIQSELAAGIYEAVQKAGMTFPFPQREIRLLHDSDDTGDHRTKQSPVSPASDGKNDASR